MSVSGIAEAAGVTRAAVTNWLRRHEDFPRPVERDAEELLFPALSVKSWLDERRIPKHALREGEQPGTTFGERFRGVSAPPAENVGRVVGVLWQALSRLRDYGLDGRVLTLGLLYFRTQPEDWAWLSDRGDLVPADLHRVASKHTEVVPGIDRLFTVSGTARAIGPVLAHLIGAISQLTEDDAVRAFTELLGPFSERTAEFATPPSLIELMLQLVNPNPAESIHDPACGTGNFLVSAAEYVLQQGGRPGPISGRTTIDSTWTLAKMNLRLHGIDADLGIGPAWALSDAPAQQFDAVLTNPPFGRWHWPEDLAPERAGWRYGPPSKGWPTFGWLQHVLASLTERGRAAVVIPDGGAFRGGNDGRVREAMIKEGVVRAVVQLPRALFATTGLGVCLWLLTPEHPGRRDVLVVDASSWGRRRDRVRQELDPAGTARIVDMYRRYLDGEAVDRPGFSKAACLDEIRKHEYRLQPAAYLAADARRADPVQQNEKIGNLQAKLGELDARVAQVDSLMHEQLRRAGLWTR